MNTLLKTGWMAAAALALVVCGCVITIPKLPDGGTVIPPAITNVISGLPSVGADTGTVATLPPAFSDNIDLSTVVWHGPDIRAWKVASDLVAGIKGGNITLATDLLKGRAQTGDNGTTGNAWAITQGTDGKLHAYSYEWIDYSRQSRSLNTAFNRDNGVPSVCTNAGFKGAVFYVAVATVSRGGKKSNGDERTPFRKVVHP